MTTARRMGALALAAQLTLLSATAHAQQAATTAQPPAAPPGVVYSGPQPQGGPDVVYLKDGQQLRGTVTEVRPGDKVTLQLPQGQIATIRWDGIQRIDRGGQAVPLEGQAAAAPPPAVIPPPPAPYLPETLPYDADRPIPAGYHVSKKPRVGMVIAGSILTGIGLIGVVGMESSDARRTDKNTFHALWGLAFFGPGLPLLLVGLLAQKKELRRDETGEWRLPARAASEGAGPREPAQAPAPDKPPPLYVGGGPLPQGGGMFTLGRMF